MTGPPRGHAAYSRGGTFSPYGVRKSGDDMSEDRKFWAAAVLMNAAPLAALVCIGGLGLGAACLLPEGYDLLTGVVSLTAAVWASALTWDWCSRQIQKWE